MHEPQYESWDMAVRRVVVAELRSSDAVSHFVTGTADHRGYRENNIRASKLS